MWLFGHQHTSAFSWTSIFTLHERCASSENIPHLLINSSPGGGGLHHTMVALKLQQFQYNPKKIFLWRLAFPMLFSPSDDPVLLLMKLQQFCNSTR